MQMLQGQLDDNVLGQLSEQIGANPEQTASAANGIFASMLGGMANNAASEGGLSSLLGALDRNHDGSVLDDVPGLIGGLLQSGGQGSGAADGLGILGHVLGGQQEAVAQQVSQSSGLNMSQVMKLLPVLAPIVMGVLGRAKSQGGLDLGNLAGILMGSAQNGAQQSGMGDLIGSVLGGVFGGGGSQQGGGGLGGILGNILGGGR
ncbi:MAG TPA: DUF937 domain-containing protein [Saprospiraceae bacterium]|nr:DUF937 domain-containing protein [Saprospiraceae bacterium]